MHTAQYRKAPSCGSYRFLPVMIQHDDHFHVCRSSHCVMLGLFVSTTTSSVLSSMISFRLMVVDKHVRLIILLSRNVFISGMIELVGLSMTMYAFYSAFSPHGRYRWPPNESASGRRCPMTTTFFRVHKLFQRVRLDAGFDFSYSFHSLRFSAEILNLRTVL